MFPLSNPELQLDIYRHRAAELHRAADEYRIARSARSAGRHARRAFHRSQDSRTPITP